MMGVYLGAFVAWAHRLWVRLLEILEVHHITISTKQLYPVLLLGVSMLIMLTHPPVRPALERAWYKKEPLPQEVALAPKGEGSLDALPRERHASLPKERANRRVAEQAPPVQGLEKVKIMVVNSCPEEPYSPPSKEEKKLVSSASELEEVEGQAPETKPEALSQGEQPGDPELEALLARVALIDSPEEPRLPAASLDAPSHPHTPGSPDQATPLREGEKNRQELSSSASTHQADLPDGLSSSVAPPKEKAKNPNPSPPLSEAQELEELLASARQLTSSASPPPVQEEGSLEGTAPLAAPSGRGEQAPQGEQSAPEESSQEGTAPLAPPPGRGEQAPQGEQSAPEESSQEENQQESTQE